MSERIHDKSGKSRRRTSSFLLVLVILILASGLWGCDLFKMFFGSPEEKEQLREQVLNAISSMITDVTQKMNTRGIPGLTPDSVAAISSNVSKMANEAVALSKLPPDDLKHLIPIVAGAAVGSLKSIVLDDDKRTASVDAIVGAFVSCMNGRFEATKNLRALSASAQEVSDIIASISMAAVTNLSKAGYASGNNTGLTAAASGIVGTMIGSLGDGGVNKIIVNTVVGGITQSAVESLQAAGLSNADALAVAVQSVTKGAVSAVTTLTVGGVGITDYPSLAAEISKSAAAALGTIATVATATSLVDAVATGAAEGVKSVKASTPTLDVLSMIQQTTAGTTVGVMSNSFAFGNSTALIQTVTSNMSQELLTGATALQPADVLSQVTQGAAAAAQVIPDAPHAADALATAIKLTLADGTQATSSTFETDITTGISIGKNNPPVANAGADKTVFVGDTVTLDGTGSRDADSDPLSYEWKLIRKPSTSTSSIAAATSSTATFLPDVPGTYIVSLKVSDGKAVAEAFCTITVLVPATSVTYQGKTAAERLATADAAIAASEFPTARDELLTILLHYPETAVFPEATYKLARCYRNLENYDLALGRYQEVVDKYPAAGNFEIWARLNIGDIKTWYIVDYAGAVAQFQNIIARNLQTADGANAIMGSGWVELAQGNYSQAQTLFAQARDLSWADLINRFYSQLGYAESYKRSGQYATAETEFNRLLSEPRFSQEDPANTGTFDPLYIFKARINLNWLYGAWGPSKKLQQIAILQDNCNDSRLLGWQRLNSCRILAERYLWDFEATSANFQLSLSTLTSAMTTYTGTDVDTQRERAWAVLRTGQANTRLGDTAALQSDKNTYYTNAITAFDNLNTSYGAFYYGVRPAGEGAIEKANLYAWGKGDYTTAITIAQQIISGYPADANQYPRAYAYFSLGQFYRDLGWNQKNMYGQNYIDKFQTALANYSHVLPENFPLVDRTTWFFIQAPRWIGDCYSGMGNYPLARSYFTSALSSSGLSAGDKAWVQLSLAKSYGEEVRQLLAAGNYTAAQDLGNNYAEPAFMAVGNYKNADTSYVKNGEPMANAYFEWARVLNDSAKAVRNAGAQPADWQALFNRAIPVLAYVTWANFPALDPTLWFFYESLSMQAYCMGEVGRFVDAQATYTTILNGIASHYISDSKKPDTLNGIAHDYHMEGQSTNSESLLLSAISELQSVIDLGSSLDGGVAAAWSFAEMGWTYSDLLHLTDYPSAVPSKMLGYYNSAASVAALAAAWQGGLIDSGQPAADAMLSCGTVLSDYAYYYRYLYPADDAQYVIYRRAAIALFQSASDTTTYPGAWIDDVMGARVSLADSWIDLAGVSGEDIVADFRQAETVVASILADPKATAKYIGQAAGSLGWGYINRGPDLVTAGYITDWRTPATNCFNLIVGTGHDPKFDSIPQGIKDNCNNGLQWLVDNPAPAPSAKSLLRVPKQAVSPMPKAPLFRAIVRDRPFFIPDPTRR